jgi:hypothetical protein
MNVDVNYLAVFLAALSAFVVGFIWYSKPLFGTTWADMVRLSDAQQKKGMPKALAFALVASLATAYVLAHVAFLSNSYFGNSFMQDSLSTAFWLWLGISAANTVRLDSFEQRRKKLTLINLGNQLATLLVMGAIIGYFKP